jgi:hypothetical protein
MNRNYFFITFFVLYGFSCIAQSDDDFQDTRRKNESFLRLPRNEIRADLATFTLSGIDEAVGKDELKKIPFTTVGQDFMNIAGDKIRATIQLSPFDKTKHKLDYDEKYLIRIDRKTYYGGYGKIPKIFISRITMTVGKDTIAIPQTAYADLYNVNLTYSDHGVSRSRNAIYESKDGHRIYLYLFCNDSTGSYEATWIFLDNKYLRRVLDYGFL